MTPSTITLGYITSVTGPASSNYADGVDGAMARIRLQNAEGGVDGRQIKLVTKDDQSNPAQDATAASALVDSPVFGVIDASVLAFAGAKALQRAGMPVTGLQSDGPEWAQQPYTNMFSAQPPSLTPFGGTYYTWDWAGTFLKSVGVTKLAALAYSISPSGITAAKGELTSANRHGISTCYENLSVPLGAVDFTAAALAIKKAGCNGVVGPLVDSSVAALSQSVKDGGVKATQYYNTAYDQNVLSNPAANAALQGAYISTLLDFSPANAATQKMLDALKKYDPHYKGGIPDFGLWTSYLGADLMIQGLEMAGKNPTRQSFTSRLRLDTNYTAGGLLPTPVSFANFGTKAMLPQTNCVYFVQLQGKNFVTVHGGKPLCSARIAIK
ncbi:MAG: ABC transporter substrate-binding protein [Acidimicrobiaceae bacterium]|nr:ABC transporter substrate-binding protein [Acidimicrobiaceae bacterium]